MASSPIRPCSLPLVDVRAAGEAVDVCPAKLQPLSLAEILSEFDFSVDFSSLSRELCRYM